MTTSDTTTASGDLGAVMAVLREHAVALAAGPKAPSRVRVEADGVAIELDWLPGAAPQPAPQPASPAAVPPAPADPPARNGSAPAPEPDAPTGHRVTAPTVGVFYRAPEPGAAPFVAEGDVVSPGRQVAIIEAMKLMIPVEADRGGRVLQVLCADGEPVEFGQPLFVLAEGG
jgi:acetyl-CoA carboxylase biotin carboxyl carrier protein